MTLTIRSGRSERSISITRENIVVPVASGSIKVYKGVKVGYLQFTSFAPPDSGDELRTQVHNVLNQGAQALVLDLRENGGGLLQEAVNVASIFIQDGTIVSTAGRSQPRQVYTALGNAFAAHIPLVVLVDRGTASRLRDRHRRAAGPSTARSSSGRTRTARASSRRSSRSRTAARSTSRSASTSLRAGGTSAAAVFARARGSRRTYPRPPIRAPLLIMRSRSRCARSPARSIERRPGRGPRAPR